MQLECFVFIDSTDTRFLSVKLQGTPTIHLKLHGVTSLMIASTILKKSLIAVAGAAALTVGTAAISASPSSALVIGAPADTSTGNCFPFGCSGTRYQQVYNSNQFSGPLSINQVSFFNTQYQPGAGVIDAANYTIYLSNTAKAVNGLDTSNFDDNIGTNRTLFFDGVLGGPIGGTKFTITGNQFAYDPSQGNLLLDIIKTSGSASGLAFLDARSGTFETASSRAQNFGSGFESFGLVTEFASSATSIPTPTLLPGLIGLGMGVLRKRKAAVTGDSEA